MMKYGVTYKFFLEFGAQLGFLLSAKSKYDETDSGEQNIKDFFKLINLGLKFGPSFDVV